MSAFSFIKRQLMGVNRRFDRAQHNLGEQLPVSVRRTHWAQALGLDADE